MTASDKTLLFETRWPLIRRPPWPPFQHFSPQIVEQAEKRVIKGEKVPPDEKLYSLFEEHTELIVRGKAGKAIEFGHKILIAQTGEKYIHHYKVMEQRIEDKELLIPAIEAHKEMFGDYPEVLSTDKGFYESMKQIISLEAKITTVSIAKKGRRNQVEYERETTEEFIDGQRFRAGSEGSISVLKRAFKLGKCFFKGFKKRGYPLNASAPYILWFPSTICLYGSESVITACCIRR